MPPEGAGDPLSERQIAVLRAWIDQGATWPDELAGVEPEHPAAEHWSFQPISAPQVPAVKNSKWVRNPIDAFILAKLENEQVEPSREADRPTLLRRVSLDLIGLPPTPPEVSAFVADESPDAYERAVDNLLQSPHYGERWGRHWLDAARYADSDGYEKDPGRPFAWRYRDWVIGALNVDMPFDVFTIQQLAGDLLAPADAEFDGGARVATGFHRNTLRNTEGGVDPEEDRVKRTIDRTNTIGSVWLGLTVGCANCHTHKYDPITQREYFGLYAFFNNLSEVDLPVAPQGQLDRWRSDRAELPQGRTGQSAATAGEEASRQAARRAEDEKYSSFQAIGEDSASRVTYVHVRGDFLSKGPQVAPHTPEILPAISSRGIAPDRLDLARWIVSESNPLTARVVANRIWQLHFGRGLVSTGDDFGTQGEPPSHPELLEWLAHEFRSNGWLMKPIHRLIVTSAAYRQSSVSRPELMDRDPYNTWLARQNRFRIEAETVRDVALSASALLNLSVGGPSVRPPQPAGVAELVFDNQAPWVESTGADRFRRGLYTWYQRTSPHPSLSTFDAPEANLACTRRERSNTPLQALTLLNDVAFVECAQAFGRRIMAESGRDAASSSDVVGARIRFAINAAVSRDPSSDELLILRRLYSDAVRHCQIDAVATEQIVGRLQKEEHTASETPIDAEAAACVILARAVLNLDEFVTRE